MFNSSGVWDYDKDGYAQIFEDYAAWGSGSTIALGAMDAGADGHQAITIACKRDIYSGGEIVGFEYEARQET